MFELVAAGIEGGSKDAVLDRWTLIDVEDLRADWARHGPPVHWMVASYFGVTKPESDTVEDPDDIAAILRQFQNGG